MSADILRIEHLVKNFRSHWSFRSREVVKDLSLQIYKGESFGFLGHNGAGKTTTIKCIMGLVRKTSGRIFFDGDPLEKPGLHRDIGYLPELPYFYEHLTTQETLDFFASLHGMRGTTRAKRVAEVLERVGLIDRAQSSVRTLSKGLQQRLGFAQAILNRPALLVLDEPFSGLDPIGRRDMRELLLELKGAGTTVFLSSHILSDVEEICDRVSIMARGELKSVFSIRDIPSLFGERFEISIAEADDALSMRSLAAAAADAISDTHRAVTDGQIRVLEFSSGERARAALQTLSASQNRVLSFNSVGLGLEDIFVQMTTGAPDKHSTPLGGSVGNAPGVLGI